MFFYKRKRFHKIRHNDKLRQFLHPAVALPNKKDYTNLIDRRIQKLFLYDHTMLQDKYIHDQEIMLLVFLYHLRD